VSFVVDCSVVARWFLADETTPYTEAVFVLLQERTAIAPSLLQAEFANVFLKLARQRKLSDDLAQGAAQRFGALGVDIDPHMPEPGRLFELASAYGLSAYDAVYLELALRRGLPLACCDGGLRQAATRAGLFLEPRLK
jgi:predicted nucleic acid-binding protein